MEKCFPCLGLVTLEKWEELAFGTSFHFMKTGVRKLRYKYEQENAVVTWTETLSWQCEIFGGLTVLMGLS